MSAQESFRQKLSIFFYAKSNFIGKLEISSKVSTKGVAAKFVSSALDCVINGLTGDLFGLTS